MEVEMLTRAGVTRLLRGRPLLMDRLAPQLAREWSLTGGAAAEALLEEEEGEETTTTEIIIVEGALHLFCHRTRHPNAPHRADGGVNPGNNLHVSGLSSRVDNRELEAVFSKMGKVRISPVFSSVNNLTAYISGCESCRDVRPSYP